MMQQPCQQETEASLATSGHRCPICNECIKDVTVLSPDQHCQLLDELAMLTHPSMMKTSVEDESIESYVPQVKIDSYYITDQFDHIVPFDTGLIEAGHKLYLHGNVFDILSGDDDSEADDNCTQVSAGRLGPLTEWWFSGFDGTNNVLIGVESEFASYFLASPHPLYSKFVIKLTEQIYLTKLVIEFLQIVSNDTADSDSYANLLESVENRSLGKFDQEFLLSHANFVIRQIISYDDAGDSDEPKLLETAAMQEFIRLVGLNFSATTNLSTQLRITRKDKRRRCNSDYEIITTPLIRQFFQPLIANHTSNEETSTSLKEHPKSISVTKSRKRTLSDRVLTSQNLSLSPNKITWTSESSFEECGDKKYFHGLKVDTESYRKGDFISYMTKESSTNGEIVKFGQIRWMSEEEISTKANKRIKRKIFHLLELLEACDTILGSNVTLGKLQDKTLYATDNCYEIRFDCIVSLMKITLITCNFTSNSLVMSRDDLTNNNNGAANKVYYCNKVYYPKCGWFTDGVDEVFNVKRFKCTGCIKLKTATVPGNGFKHIPDPIQVGSYILINPDVIEPALADHFNDWLTQSYQQSVDETMRQDYDKEIYTEKYRKSFIDSNKGSLTGLIETYAVGLVEGKTSSPYAVRVRLLYRSQNIYPDPEYIYTCDERELFLTDIVLTIPISANMGNLVKKKFNKNFKHEFTTDFFIERSYLTKTGTICILSEKVILSLDTNDDNATSKLIPLSSLDLFAGCGGFSLGFEQMNVTNTKWAIERDPVAAESFKKNFPTATVTVKDANQVLKEILDDRLDDGCQMSGHEKVKSKYPTKGEIDIILAGPPCQGFSEINRFTDGRASNIKNSLIATTLSFVDIYRPKYVYIENVRNFFKFKESTIFRLTLSSLLYMGYQVTFCLLQAGSLGVPQSRCRAIIIATAPGLPIPKMPHLSTSFPSKLIPESVVIQDTRYTLNVIPYSLHRPLTIKDAISDLPPDTGDDASSLVPYLHMKACSSYQQRMRSPNSTHVSDQVSRATGLLVSSRIKLIPKSRGADWRDLPNICVQLDENSTTQKLRYTHHDSKVDDSSVKRGVCSCAQTAANTSNINCNGDKQSNTLIPWCLVHTASKNYHWVGVYGRVAWDEYFSTTVTIPEPSAKQGRVIHPSEDRLLTVRELARSQGIPDWFTISGKLADRHRQIGNAVPPPLASALARCLLQSRINNESCSRKLKAPITWD